MGKQQGKTASKRIRYFFLNGDLHKTIHINRSSDIVVAWNYPNRKRTSYSWSDAQKNMEKAYTITDVAKILDRHRMTIDKYIRQELIKTPQRIYKIDGKFDSAGKYMFSEKDVLDLHEFCSTISKGRPRKDGLINTSGLPSRSEVKSMLKQSSVLYVKDEDGNFIPVWKENNW
jgi:hypothetical protein